jgi:hypothetical protein
MRQLVPVKVGQAEFYIEAIDADAGRLTPIADTGMEPQVFQGIRNTVEAVTDELVEALRRARPDEATVTFGMSAALNSGRLTGLLMDAKGEATIQVTLTWKRGGGDAVTTG